MGLTSATVTIRNTRSRSRTARVTLLVDSGAAYTVLPQRIWKAMRLRKMREMTFAMVDGTLIKRWLGEAEFEFEGVTATSNVVLGGPKDEPLLGVVTLENLGLALNPLTRELKPITMSVARLRD